MQRTLSWMRGALLAALALTLWGLGPAGAGSAKAAQWPPLSLPELCGLSSDIVLATVRSQHCVRAEHASIFTRYELDVIERVLPAGGRERSMTIEQPGGTIGDEQQFMSGMQHFTVGEEVIIFSGTAANGRKVALAGPRGALRVVEGELPGLESAFPALAGLDPAAFLARVRQVIDQADAAQQ